jgi:hypothetical protein
LPVYMKDELSWFDACHDMCFTEDAFGMPN